MYVAIAERDPGARIMRAEFFRDIDQPRKEMGEPGSRNASADFNVRCAYCGLQKQKCLGYLKRITCVCYEKKNHPWDRSQFVCRGCGETYELGKCQLENIYNLIHQWYNPTKHTGMLPEKTEKMIN